MVIERSAAKGLTFETAAQLVTPNVPKAVPTATAGELLSMLQGRRYDYASDVAVCDGERLAGLVSMEQLLAAPPASRVVDMMDAHPAAVAPEVDQEVAAWTTVQHGQRSLAVVDEEGRFVGLVPPQRLMFVLLREHEEDMARLGGFLRQASSARTALEEPVLRRFWHRIPWLMAGLAGAMLAARIMGAFEEELQRVVLLAFFVPSIVYLADAVGTQTEALVIRGLSVGVSIGSVVRRELLTGLAIGLALAAGFYPFALWQWDNGSVAMAVAVALVAACSTATIVALALPWAFQKLGYDPAFGSGPLATVIQDIVSLVIYLGVAVALVT